jgi:hypothetical protein
MNNDEITKEQAAQMAKVIGRSLGCLFRLRKRMADVGFPQDDPLFKLVDSAYDATHRLWVDLHYRSCGIKDMTGRPEATIKDQLGPK